jgi:hypothetical protein
MAGRQVHLGAASENAQWQIGSSTRFVAVDGDLQLNADLMSGTGSHISLQAGSGQVRMAVNSEIRSEGALVTVKAASGIEVGRIDTSSANGLQGAVALDSAGGRIVLAGTYTSGLDLGVSAQSVSFHGYGQALKATDGDRVLRVESERLQVSAPSGVSSRGQSSVGEYYRLMDQGKAYAQLLVTGQAPERVMLPVTEGGELGGNLKLMDGRPLGRVRLQLLHPQGHIQQETATLSDGFFMFNKIYPGQWRVRLSPEQNVPGVQLDSIPVALTFTDKDRFRDDFHLYLKLDDKKRGTLVIQDHNPVKPAAGQRVNGGIAK